MNVTYGLLTMNKEQSEIRQLDHRLLMVQRQMDARAGRQPDQPAATGRDLRRLFDAMPDAVA